MELDSYKKLVSRAEEKAEAWTRKSSSSKSDFFEKPATEDQNKSVLKRRKSGGKVI